MEIIKNASLDIEAQCGGCCSCATCHVYIDPDHWSRIGERTPDEDDMLDLVDGVKETSRLSCQILYSEAMDGLKVEIAPE
jgi:2Fe-2S ferredoxin